MQQIEPTHRPYQAVIDLPQNVFHESEAAYLLPLVDLKAGSELQFELLSEASAIQPFHVLQSKEPECLAFVTDLQVENLGFGLLLAYPSWMSQRRRRIADGELVTTFRHQSGVYAFTAVNKATLITTCHVSERLHDFLTMM